MFDHFLDLNILISIFASVEYCTVIFFLIFSTVFLEAQKLQNPWNSNSLEWTTPVEHVHGNWIGEIPICTGGLMIIASRKGKDFVPQNILFENEEEHYVFIANFIFKSVNLRYADFFYSFSLLNISLFFFTE